MREAWKDDGWTEGRYWQMRRHAKSWLTPVRADDVPIKIAANMT